MLNGTFKSDRKRLLSIDQFVRNHHKFQRGAIKLQSILRWALLVGTPPPPTLAPSPAIGELGTRPQGGRVLNGPCHTSQELEDALATTPTLPHMSPSFDFRLRASQLAYFLQQPIYVFLPLLRMVPMSNLWYSREILQSCYQLGGSCNLSPLHERVVASDPSYPRCPQRLVCKSPGSGQETGIALIDYATWQEPMSHESQNH